jgi:hypothetical protein
VYLALFRHVHVHVPKQNRCHWLQSTRWIASWREVKRNDLRLKSWIENSPASRVLSGDVNGNGKLQQNATRKTKENQGKLCNRKVCTTPVYHLVDFNFACNHVIWVDAERFSLFCHDLYDSLCIFMQQDPVSCISLLTLFSSCPVGIEL